MSGMVRAFCTVDYSQEGVMDLKVELYDPDSKLISRVTQMINDWDELPLPIHLELSCYGYLEAQ